MADTPPQSPADEPKNQQHATLDQEDQETQIVSDDPEQDDPEAENEGMSVPNSPPPHNNTLETKGNPSVRRVGHKRKKTNFKNYRSVAALEKKLQTLSANFNPIPFVPAKVLDFSPHRDLLKRLGLWEFAHIEFDRNLRSDLIAKLVVDYVPSKRGSRVNGYKVGVNRADIGRAFKLPAGRKAPGEGDLDEYPSEFLSFLEEFVSNWMLLHEDLWITPTEVVNVLNLIRDRHPEKVDWAGLIWFMVEKELAQGVNLKDCYYASHLQQLIKLRREELLKEDVVVELTAEEDDDGGDVKMLDVEELSQKSEDQSVELKLGQGLINLAENYGEVDKVEKVEDVEKDENVDDVQKFRSIAELQKMENVESAKCVENVDVVDEHVRSADDVDEHIRNGDEGMENADERTENADECTENTDERNEDADDERNEDADDERDEDAGDEPTENDGDEPTENAGDEPTENALDEPTKNTHDEPIEYVDEHVENVEHADELVNNVDKAEDAGDVNKEMDMMGFGYEKGDEQGQWLFGGKDNGGQHFLQPCMGGVKASSEDDRHDGLDKDMEEEDNEEDEHVEGFKIMQKGPLDGMPSANFEQAFGTGQLQFTSPELGGQSSLELMPSRNDNNMIMGSPSMFNHFGKRQIGLEHDSSHQDLNDNHKKMRIDNSWDPDYHMQQAIESIEKAKMSFETKKAQIYQQATVTEQIMSQQIAEKENENLQLRFKLHELQRQTQADIHQRDRELCLMSSVIDGYRRALKQSQKQFSDFRKLRAISSESIYKDAGNGGVVKSIMELEKERIKQEEEKKIMYRLLEETYNNNMDDYMFKWEEILAKVEYFESKLLNAEKEVESLKDDLLKNKSSESAQNES